MNAFRPKIGAVGGAGVGAPHIGMHVSNGRARAEIHMSNGRAYRNACAVSVAALCARVLCCVTDRAGAGGRGGGWGRGRGVFRGRDARARVCARGCFVGVAGWRMRGSQVPL